MPQNPYSPEANPFMTDAPAPGVPDDILDGPPNPAGQDISVPVTTRPRQIPGASEAEEEMAENNLPTLLGSLLPLYCMKSGHRFAARLVPGLRCVCGEFDYDIDFDQTRVAMETDPPLGLMTNFIPEMDELSRNDQFSVPFQEEGPKGLEDQPFNGKNEEGEESEEEKVASIAQDILRENPKVGIERAVRLALLTMKEYPSVGSRTRRIA